MDLEAFITFLEEGDDRKFDMFRHVNNMSTEVEKMEAAVSALSHKVGAIRTKQRREDLDATRTCEELQMQVDSKEELAEQLHNKQEVCASGCTPVRGLRLPGSCPPRLTRSPAVFRPLPNAPFSQSQVAKLLLTKLKLAVMSLCNGARAPGSCLELLVESSVRAMADSAISSLFGTLEGGLCSAYASSTGPHSCSLLNAAHVQVPRKSALMSSFGGSARKSSTPMHCSGLWRSRVHYVACWSTLCREVLPRQVRSTFCRFATSVRTFLSNCLLLVSLPRCHLLSC
jgi:hypothetical protein